MLLSVGLWEAPLASRLVRSLAHEPEQDTFAWPGHLVHGVSPESHGCRRCIAVAEVDTGAEAPLLFTDADEIVFAVGVPWQCCVHPPLSYSLQSACTNTIAPSHRCSTTPLLVHWQHVCTVTSCNASCIITPVLYHASAPSHDCTGITVTIASS
eukprot:374348-Rhodomonas_salina.2